MFKKKSFLFKIVLTSVMIALNIVLERLLAYSVWNQTISFSFVTIGFTAVFLGWPYAVAVGALGDFIGAMILPFGPYFFGFTLTNAIAAFITGIFISRKATPIRIVSSVLINKIVCSLLLNTIWIAALYRGGIAAFFAVLVTRLAQAAIMFAVESIAFILLFSEKSKIRHQLNRAFTNMQ